MATKKASKVVTTGQGFCCPHCADSKFPCVNMEKAMESRTRQEPEPDKKRES